MPHAYTNIFVVLKEQSAVFPFINTIPFHGMISLGEFNIMHILRLLDSAAGGRIPQPTRQICDCRLALPLAFRGIGLRRRLRVKRQTQSY